jgi:aryl-alcohol dehydrogenase-like predicted oxidoreductase
VRLIPGTSTVGHLRDNLAAEHAILDDEALRLLEALAPDQGASGPVTEEARGATS